MLPGDRFSVDGVIITGRTAADESSLTGESIPISKGPGDTVRAGTSSAVDGSAVRVKATATGARSVLASVIALVEDAQVTFAMCFHGGMVRLQALRWKFVGRGLS